MTKKSSWTAIGLWYERHFLILDWVVAGTVGGLLLWRIDHSPVQEVFETVLKNSRAAYTALASIFGSLLGFAIAAVTITLTAIQSPRLRTIRQSRHYGTLWSTFKACIRWLAIATAGAFIAIAIDSDGTPSPAIAALVFGLSMLASLRVLHAIRVLEAIVTVVVSREATDRPSTEPNDSPN